MKVIWLCPKCKKGYDATEWANEERRKIIKKIKRVIKTYRFDLTINDTKTYCDDGLYIEVENLLSKLGELE